MSDADKKYRVDHIQPLVELVIVEDLKHRYDDELPNAKAVRKLAVIAPLFTSAYSAEAKKEQEIKLEKMAAPEDDPVLLELEAKCVGKFFYDHDKDYEGTYEVVRISYVVKYGAKCWEATVASVVLSCNGEWKTPANHYIIVGEEAMIDPSKLASYVLTDVTESQFPVYPADVDEMIAAHEAREVDRLTATASAEIAPAADSTRPAKRARRFYS
jgi:hypothetical protein